MPSEGLLVQSPAAGQCRCTRGPPAFGDDRGGARRAARCSALVAVPERPTNGAQPGAKSAVVPDMALTHHPIETCRCRPTAPPPMQKSVRRQNRTTYGDSSRVPATSRSSTGSKPTAHEYRNFPLRLHRNHGLLGLHHAAGVAPFLHRRVSAGEGRLLAYRNSLPADTLAGGRRSSSRWWPSRGTIETQVREDPQPCHNSAQVRCNLVRAYPSEPRQVHSQETRVRPWQGHSATRR